MSRLEPVTGPRDAPPPPAMPVMPPPPASAMTHFVPAVAGLVEGGANELPPPGLPPMPGPLLIGIFGLSTGWPPRCTCARGTRRGNVHDFPIGRDPGAGIACLSRLG